MYKIDASNPNVLCFIPNVIHSCKPVFYSLRNGKRQIKHGKMAGLKADHYLAVVISDRIY